MANPTTLSATTPPPWETSAEAPKLAAAAETAAAPEVAAANPIARSVRSAAPALAQVPSSPTSPSLTLSRLREGPSVYETGRIGITTVTGGGSKISDTRPDGGKPKEVAVQAKQPDPEAAPPTLRQGAVNSERFDHEVHARFVLLRDCRTEVALRRHLAAAAVVAERLTLRWTILPTGEVADTQVVATTGVDGWVMDCVKREMSQWQFTPPRGGPVRIERLFRFASDERSGRRGPNLGHPHMRPARYHKVRASHAHRRAI